MSHDRMLKISLNSVSINNIKSKCGCKSCSFRVRVLAVFSLNCSKCEIPIIVISVPVGYLDLGMLNYF